MKKRSILSFLICSALVLFVFISCGIPRMFPWRDTYQYNIDSDSIDFKLRFKTSGSDEYWPKLIPSPNTPILRTVKANIRLKALPSTKYQQILENITEK